MNKCKSCGSYAINPKLHGRDGKSDLDLCDVCYWRKRADAREITLGLITGLLDFAQGHGGKAIAITDIKKILKRGKM